MTAVHVSSHKALSQLLILHCLLILHDFIDSVCITLFVRLSVVIFIPLYLLYRTMYFLGVVFNLERTEFTPVWKVLHK